MLQAQLSDMYNQLRREQQRSLSLQRRLQASQRDQEEGFQDIAELVSARSRIQMLERKVAHLLELKELLEASGREVAMEELGPEHQVGGCGYILRAIHWHVQVM